MRIKGHSLNLGKVASSVVTEKPSQLIVLSVFIEREGALVLRRCCFHWRMRKFLARAVLPALHRT